MHINDFRTCAYFHIVRRIKNNSYTAAYNIHASIFYEMNNLINEIDTYDADHKEEDLEDIFEKAVISMVIRRSELPIEEIFYDTLLNKLRGIIVTKKLGIL